MIKFEDFTPGDDKICFSDGTTDWRLDRTEYGQYSFYTLKQYDDKSGGTFWKCCYKWSDKHNTYCRIDAQMPNGKEAFKRKAKSLLTKIDRLG